MSEDAGESGRYRAFLSYSHKDAVAGAKLHRRLEAYRIPKHLVGSTTARGMVPARLAPIFRDREELGAAESLTDSVKTALSASESLIVMCSPDAKTSIWVAKEIALFRGLHPDRPVLAALVSGEPTEAFPDDLARLDPIAADFRKGRDGGRLALLKLVAGMTALPLDALVQRDAQRQLRRVTAVTGGAFAAVLVMALLLAFALRAQAEAERQRAEAEGLVEYMLTDLRDRLKGVGRLDVMTAVNERAMRYYGGQGDLSRLPPDSLDRRARILHAMGEDDDKRGNLGLALAKFKEAHRTTAAALARRPDDERVIFAHAQSEYWVGYAAHFQNKDRAALDHFKRYQKLAERLVASDRTNPTWKREAAYAEGNLCTLYLEPPMKMGAAMQSCRASLDHMIEARALDPKDKASALAVPNRYAWLADVHEATGDLERAAALRRNQMAICDKQLKLTPDDAQWQESALLARVALSKTLRKQGLIEQAEERMTEARSMAARRLASNPDDAKIREIMQVASTKVAD